MKLLIMLIPYLLSGISIIGCWYNIKKKNICWLIWEGSAFGFAYYYIFIVKDYGSALIWIFYIFFDAYGFLEWRKDKGK